MDGLRRKCKLHALPSRVAKLGKGRGGLLTTKSAPSSQFDSPSRRKFPTTRMAKTRRVTRKISKLRSSGFPRHQETMITKGALKRAVWMEGPRQWYKATFIAPSVTADVSENRFLGPGLGIRG